MQSTWHSLELQIMKLPLGTKTKPPANSKWDNDYSFGVTARSLRLQMFHPPPPRLVHKDSEASRRVHVAMGEVSGFRALRPEPATSGDSMAVLSSIKTSPTF